MIGNFEWENSHIHRLWDLPRLIADLERVKARALSDFEVQCLYGLLSRYNLSLIATKLHWSLNALRTELSRGLYTYIKDLLNRDRIVWSKIPDWLAPNYAKPQQGLVRQPDRSLDSFRASEIIARILVKQAADRDRPRSICAQRASEMMALKDYGDLRLKSGQQLEAIKIYTEVLESDLSWLGLLNKIAACFYKLELYNDVGEICNFLLCHTCKDNIKLVAYNFLGLISRQSAIRDYSELHVDRGIYYFTQAKELSTFDVLPIWNTIEILLKFASERHYYLQRAKLALPEFIELAADPQSNFSRYRERILVEAMSVFPEDEWWQNAYLQLDRLSR